MTRTTIQKMAEMTTMRGMITAKTTVFIYFPTLVSTFSVVETKAVLFSTCLMINEVFTNTGPVSFTIVGVLGC